MTGKNKNKSQPKSRPSPKKKKSSPGFTNSATTRYDGPLRIPRTFEQDHVIAQNFSYYFPLNATVGGVVDNSYADSSVASVNDWANLAGAFHEYRVLAFEMKYVPLVSYTTNYPPFATVVDRQTSLTLGAYTAAANHESVQLDSSRYNIKRVIKMDGVDESGWIATSTTAAHMYIKMYGSGFTSAQNVGNILFTYLVQFRGRA